MYIPWVLVWISNIEIRYGTYLLKKFIHGPRMNDYPFTSWDDIFHNCDTGFEARKMFENRDLCT